METVRAVYERAFDFLESRQLGRYVEPLAHVLEVERLRELYRPAGGIRMLIIAESHVRVGDEHFRRKGVGFIYEHRYYTPWWHTLLLPALGEAQATSAANRLQLLKHLKSRGIWIIDASLLSLSGYQKVEKIWPKRPLDEFREHLIADFWKARTGIAFERAMNQPSPPVVCVFRNVVFAIPEEFRRNATVINFLGPANSANYLNSDYEYGTAKFCEAANAAGIKGRFFSPD